MGTVTRENGPEGSVSVVLSNPGRRNAISSSMWEGLAAHAVRIQTDSGIRAVVLRGAGEDFSSGFDLAELADLTPSEVQEEFQRMEEAIAEVERIPVPVIAAIRGYCLGGALELASACDIRVADRTAQMGMPVARIGIMLSRRFADRLLKVLGVGAAKELLLSGHLLTAERSFSLGAVQAVAGPDEPISDVVDRFLRDVASLHPAAVRQAKASVAEVLPATAEDTPYTIDPEAFFEAISRFRHHPG